MRTSAPHEAIFACLSIYPGTEDYRLLLRDGRIDSDIYFKDDFQELKVPLDATDEDTQLMSDWFERNRGIRVMHIPTVEECKGVLDGFGDLHAAHVDLAGAYYRGKLFSEARQHLHRALELGYPAPGLVYSYLASIDAFLGDVDSMLSWTRRAQEDPMHAVVARNMRLLSQWQAAGSPREHPPHLIAWHDFELMEVPKQPVLPGPLPDGFERWEDVDC